MMKTSRILQFTNSVFVVCFCSLLFSCGDEQIELIKEKSVNQTLLTRSIVPETFDWEHADWMPTPLGQAKIPIPWVGQGSISSIFGIDIVNDIKASEGWELLYNTFDSNSTGPLVNPYFILYNKYRGVMRIFLYTTTQFVASSTYIQDGISIVSNYKSSLLNFMGEDIIDPSVNKQSYSQIQPAPLDGSLPLASNKWYMIQYELAYDSGISKLLYNDIQFSWSINYYNIESINLGGEIKGTITGTVGASGGTTGNNIFSALGNVGKVAGTGVIAGIGDNFITNNTINSQTGTNKLGLPKSIFKNITKGIQSAISSSTGNLPGAIINIFSSLFRGSSGGPKLVNLNLNASINLQGSGSSSGSFPSSPTSFWMPGTTIPTSASGYIPLYNKDLGVFNFVGNKPKVAITGESIGETTMESNYCPTHARLYFPKNNYSQYLIFNPAVKDIATIEIRKQDILLVPKEFYWAIFKEVTCSGKEKMSDSEDNEVDMYVNPSYIHIYYNEYTRLANGEILGVRLKDLFDLVVRFTIDVKPKNGGQGATIVKTFKLDSDFTNVFEDLLFGDEGNEVVWP